MRALTSLALSLTLFAIASSYSLRREVENDHLLAKDRVKVRFAESDESIESSEVSFVEKRETELESSGEAPEMSRRRLTKKRAESAFSEEVDHSGERGDERPRHVERRSVEEVDGSGAALEEIQGSGAATEELQGSGSGED